MKSVKASTDVCLNHTSVDDFTDFILNLETEISTNLVGIQNNLAGPRVGCYFKFSFIKSMGTD